MLLSIAPLGIVLGAVLLILGNVQPARAGVTFSPSLLLPDLQVTKEQTESMAKITANCTSPPSIYPLSECSNSTVIAKGLTEAYKIYHIVSLGPKIAIAATSAFESGSYRANINHFPENPNRPGEGLRPGQGTKAMLMFKHLFRFAASVKSGALLPQITQIIGRNVTELLNMDQAATDTILDALTEEKQRAVRTLVLPDEFTFQAAAWFLVNKCSPQVYDGLKEGYQGFLNYTEIPSCIDVEKIEEGRKDMWCAAAKALKPSYMDPPSECVPK